MKKLVVLLAGGFSEERAVSLDSSKAINEALVKLGYEVMVIDPREYSSWLETGSLLSELDPYIVFNGLHGGAGEDGTLQAYLSLLKIPFTGSGFKASALAMDKLVSYKIASSLGLLIPEYYTAGKEDSVVNKNTDINGKLVVKPNCSGSSYGISIIDDGKDLNKAVKQALKYSSKAIIQRYISGSELTVSILDGQTLPVVEIKAKDGWYDYTHKYTKGKTEYIVPAGIAEETAQKLQQQAFAVYEDLGCSGYARVDFRYDGEKAYFLELNTLPGMTSLSLTPMAAAAAGINFKQMIKKIVLAGSKKGLTI